MRGPGSARREGGARRRSRPPSRASRPRAPGSSRASSSEGRAGLSRRRSRLLSSSDWRVSGSAEQIASADSYVHPPAQTDEGAKELLFVSSSRSYDHSIVARSVCWRGSASRPALSRSSLWASRSRSCSGVKTTVRAAASSSASGRLSRRAQSSMTAGENCAMESSASARVTKSVDAVVVVERGNRVHVLALELETLATRDQDRRASTSRRRAISLATAGRRCSALSSRSSARLPSSRSATLSASSRPGCSSTRSACGERGGEQMRRRGAERASPTRRRRGRPRTLRPPPEWRVASFRYRPGRSA